MRIIIEPISGNKHFEKGSLDYDMFYSSIDDEPSCGEFRSLADNIRAALDWGETETEHNNLKITIEE